MRARLALRLAEIEVEIQEIELRNRPPELYAVSPKGTVPVLVLDNGKVIDESVEIVDWALGCSDSDLELIKKCDGDFKHHLDRYKYSTRYQGADPVVHRAEGVVFINQLNQHLTDNNFLSGGTFGVKDICVAPFVRQFRIADPEWFDSQEWPALHAWLQAYLESPDFKAIMVKVRP
jgi:glutathione S-transferase